MSKSNELKRMYKRIDLDSTYERELLSSVKNGTASNEDINTLLAIIGVNKNGGKILNDIVDVETTLVTDFNVHVNALEKIGEEYNDVAHYEDESKKDRKFVSMQKRYKERVKKAEDILDAIKKAYFQIDKFDGFEKRLYDVKQELFHFE